MTPAPLGSDRESDRLCWPVSLSHKAEAFLFVSSQLLRRKAARGTRWMSGEELRPVFHKEHSVCTLVILHQSLSVSVCEWWNWEPPWGNAEPLENGSLWTRATMEGRERKRKKKKRKKRKEKKNPLEKMKLSKKAVIKTGPECNFLLWSLCLPLRVVAVPARPYFLPRKNLALMKLLG